jgi:hypothetical protein
VKQELRDVQTPERTRESLTALSEVAYLGPSKEDLVLPSTPNGAEPPQAQVQVTMEDVFEGFRDLEKDMSASKMLTVLLRALAKDETENLLAWLLWERFKDNPPADRMGHW